MFHTQGIILKKNTYREYDEILTIWTRDFGKIEAIARGVKKPLSKLNGHLQVFDLSDIEFALGKRFKVLTGARLIQGHCEPRGNQSLSLRGTKPARPNGHSGRQSHNLFDIRRQTAMRQTFASFFNFLDEITPLEDADSRIWQLCLDVVHSPSSVIAPPSSVIASEAKQSLLRLTGFK